MINRQNLSTKFTEFRRVQLTAHQSFMVLLKSNDCAHVAKIWLDFSEIDCSTTHTFIQIDTLLLVHQQSNTDRSASAIFNIPKLVKKIDEDIDKNMIVYRISFQVRSDRSNSTYKLFMNNLTCLITFGISFSFQLLICEQWKVYQKSERMTQKIIFLKW